MCQPHPAHGNWSKPMAWWWSRSFVPPACLIPRLKFDRPGAKWKIWWKSRSIAGDGDRTIVTVLTKRLAEDLCRYLEGRDLRVRWLHSEVETLERLEILRACVKETSMSSWGSICCEKGWTCPRWFGGDHGCRQERLLAVPHQHDPDHWTGRGTTEVAASCTPTK